MISKTTRQIVIISNELAHGGFDTFEKYQNKRWVELDDLQQFQRVGITNKIIFEIPLNIWKNATKVTTNEQTNRTNQNKQAIS